MSICMSGTEARLEGNWTLDCVSRNLDLLARSLQQLQSLGVKKLKIDCAHIKETDVSGLEFLNVWMQCARFRGVEPTLVNVPERLRYAMQALIGHCIVDVSPDVALMAG